MCTIVNMPAEVLGLLQSLHHYPQKVQHLEEVAEPLLTEAALPFLLLEHAESASLHRTDLHVQAHTHTKAQQRRERTNMFVHTSYLQGECVLVCVQPFWEKAGHEVTDVGDVGYLQGAELKKVEAVALPKSRLVQLWTQQICVNQPSGAVL